MKYPLVRELADEGFPVRLTCEVLEIAPQPYYRWLRRPLCQRELRDAHLVNELHDLHRDDPPFGYRFLCDELKDRGHQISETSVHRLCKQNKIWSTTTKKGKRHSGKAPGPAVADDLVKRVFSAPAPNQIWLTDITEHPTSEGTLYCCSLKDLFSNRIVGYAIGDHMTAELACAALRMAIARRQPAGTVIVHADRGSQFRSRAFRAVLRASGLTLSMGRVASAADNAAMESFHALLQKNVLDQRRTWATRSELRYAIITWIEHTYHRRRRQRALGKMTPVEFELAFTRHTEVAA
jgi:transposase InsO family protein